MADGSTKVVYSALAGNVLVALSKFAAATISGSAAMLTEAIHSTADSANQLLLLIGNKRSRMPPDASHPFGYGLEIYFWTFVVAVMVLLAGGMVSLYEGFRRLAADQPIDAPIVSLLVLALSAAFEGWSFSVGYREYKRVILRHRISGELVGLWRFIILSKDPNLYETILEDGAALIGIAIAAVGVVASGYLGLHWADGAASIAIGLLLVADAFLILAATRGLIAGEAVAPAFLKDLRKVLQEKAWSNQVVDIATLHLGPFHVLVALHLRRAAFDGGSVTGAALLEMENLVRSVDARIEDVLFRFD